METLTNYYRALFWSPEPVHTLGDYLIALLMITLVWVALWWLFALLMRMIDGDLLQSAGTYTGIRIIWARCALILAALSLADIGIVWYFEKLSDWTSIIPHATLACAGAAIAVWIGLVLRSELKENRKKVFNALPKSPTSVGATS
jgi:hypothetical protein